MRIYLVGFMGSGKTFTGKRLAESLGFSFADLDDLIKEDAGQSISGIFAANGEAYFRRLERRALHRTGDMENTVISTGGGAPCYFDNMEWMNAHGITVFLDTPAEMLATRLLPERAHRPLLQPYDEDTLADFIQSKLSERMYFYGQAAIVYPQRELTGDVAGELLKIIDGRRKT